MTMNDWARQVFDPQRWTSARRSALPAVFAATFALALTACGPGVGGTGTGDTPSALTTFGAASTSVCGSDLAPLLSCPAGGSTAAPAPGAAPVHLADTIDGRRVLATANGNSIELQAPCARLQFRGEWGVVAGQAGRFFGYTDPDGAAAPATLQVQAVGGGLQFTLRNAAGDTLLGPIVMTVVTTAGTPGGCN